jgi:hypothetical protein
MSCPTSKKSRSKLGKFIDGVGIILDADLCILTLHFGLMGGLQNQK